MLRTIQIFLYKSLSFLELRSFGIKTMNNFFDQAIFQSQKRNFKNVLGFCGTVKLNCKLVTCSGNRSTRRRPQFGAGPTRRRFD